MQELSTQEMLDSVKGEMDQDTTQNATETSGQNVSSSVQDSGQKTSGAPTTQPQMYEYQWAGKSIKEPLETILKKASMGHDYAQKMQAWNQEKAGWSQKEKDYQTKLQALERWKSYDEYAAQNKPWADHVEKMWAEKDRYSNAEINPDDPIIKHVTKISQQLEDRLKSFETKFSDVDGYIKQSKTSAEVQSLDNEIKGVQEQFKNVDFNQVDDQGKSLTNRIYEHMTKEQIPSFRAAFKDFYFDTLLQKERETAKESAAKDLQKRNKTGLLGVSSTPHKEDLSSSQIKNLSYEELSNAAKRELGIN